MYEQPSRDTYSESRSSRVKCSFIAANRLCITNVSSETRYVLLPIIPRFMTACVRMTITFKDHGFSHDKSRELIRLMEFEIPQVIVLCQASWKWMRRELSTLTSSIKICSNILPWGAYRERLQELVQKQSFWTRVQSSMLWRIPCFMGRRRFFFITVINQAREKDVPLM